MVVKEMNDIGKKLKSLRKAKRLTQQSAADALGLKRSTVSNYEIGRRLPPIDYLQNAAAFYGVGLDFFGVVATDYVSDILMRADEVFNSPNISDEAKNQLYKELSKMYLQLK
jgi:transcriptional regulator with XRE-family HTH domain